MMGPVNQRDEVSLELLNALSEAGMIPDNTVDLTMRMPRDGPILFDCTYQVKEKALRIIKEVLTDG